MRFMVGIDVGGTFTDFVAYNDDTREIQVWKHISMPSDPGEGILRGLVQFAHRRLSVTSESARPLRLMRSSSVRAPGSPF